MKGRPGKLPRGSYQMKKMEGEISEKTRIEEREV